MTAVTAVSIATARRRPAKGSFMGSLRSYDYCVGQGYEVMGASLRKRLRETNYENRPKFCQP
jgi:hypothetical protein